MTYAWLITQDATKRCQIFSQSTVVTHLMCGGIFISDLITLESFNDESHNSKRIYKIDQHILKFI